MPMLLALNIWMTVSRRMVTVWPLQERPETPALPQPAEGRA
jgi:hypothetical protein